MYNPEPMSAKLIMDIQKGKMSASTKTREERKEDEKHVNS